MKLIDAMLLAVTAGIGFMVYKFTIKSANAATPQQAWLSRPQEQNLSTSALGQWLRAPSFDGGLSRTIIEGVPATESIAPSQARAYPAYLYEPGTLGL